MGFVEVCGYVILGAFTLLFLFTVVAIILWMLGKN